MIVDASVAAKWILQEPGSELALRLLEEETLRAPDFFMAELANVCWKAWRRGAIGAAAAREGHRHACAGIAEFVSITDLIDRALELAIVLEHPVYDCCYMALAERLGETLVTADKRLLIAVKDTRLAATVSNLGDQT